jgi:superoxide reductase
VLHVNTIQQAIDEYHKYHAPEVIANLKVHSQNIFCVLFSGSFCQTCGFYDYFDDFKFLLADHGIDTTVTQITETDTGAYVYFQRKRVAGIDGTETKLSMMSETNKRVS